MFTTQSSRLRCFRPYLKYIVHASDQKNLVYLLESFPLLTPALVTLLNLRGEVTLIDAFASNESHRYVFQVGKSRWFISIAGDIATIESSSASPDGKFSRPRYFIGN